jgi:hypothetical protein
MNYDNWKQQSPPDSDDYGTCRFCGDKYELSLHDDGYCSSSCRKADYND